MFKVLTFFTVLARGSDKLLRKIYVSQSVQDERERCTTYMRIILYCFKENLGEKRS